MFPKYTLQGISYLLLKCLDQRHDVFLFQTAQHLHFSERVFADNVVVIFLFKLFDGDDITCILVLSFVNDTECTFTD